MNGEFRFDGVPPGVYYLNIRGEVNTAPYELVGRELFLPVGEVLRPHFFEVKPVQ